METTIMGSTLKSLKGGNAWVYAAWLVWSRVLPRDHDARYHRCLRSFLSRLDDAGIPQCPEHAEYYMPIPSKYVFLCPKSPLLGTLQPQGKGTKRVQA